jgi:WD40 repeat protein
MSAVEFEHSIGNTILSDGLCYHPNGENYVYCAGSSVVVGHLSNPQSQEFLRGHDGPVTCISLSPSGRYLASGQEGDRSDIYVWDFETKKKVFSFEEHDYKIERVAFSDDERLLASIGSNEDGNLFFWDMSNGAIVASHAHMPKDTKCITFGGFIRDIKRRDTHRYQMCSGGAQGLIIWDLDPYSGELNSTKIVGDARATISRDITAITFSYDREYLFAATFSGDFLVVSMKSLKIVRAVPATRMGLCAIHALRDAIVIGGGDGSLILFDPVELRELRRVNPDGTAVRAIAPSPDRLEVN